MKQLILTSLLGFLFLQGGGQPIDIPITASGWRFGPNTGPYGTNGCYAGNGTAPCAQDVGFSPAHFQEYKPGYTIPGFYTFTFTISNYFPNYPAYGTAEIHYGSQELCDQDVWGEGVGTQITMICPSPGYLIVDHSLPGPGPAQGQYNLVVSLHGSNWEDLFDYVSLKFTPQ